jgi:hypothetical protein
MSTTSTTGLELSDPVAGEAFLAPASRWEPCPEATPADEHGLCAGCGWPADEHAGLFEFGLDPSAPNVVTMPVPERPRLRKAS